MSPDSLENNLASFEAEASRALERIIAARSFTDDDDQACLFNLLALMAVKNPRHRQTFASFRDKHGHGDARKVVSANAPCKS